MCVVTGEKMYQLKVKCPYSLFVTFGEFETHEQAANTVDKMIQFLVDYERGKSVDARVEFKRDSPRPDITNLFSPVANRYGENANLRATFVIQEM